MTFPISRILCAVIFVSCFATVPMAFSTERSRHVNEKTSLADESLKVGAERVELYLPLLKGKRVGLLVNQTSRVGRRHLVDFLQSHDINVTLIFAPEHGFRGEYGAGEKVINSRVKQANIPIFSLHGKHRKPTKEQLDRIDVLIYDIQDVGVRFYTYISSLHYLMQSCAESKKALIVLDRPNPNGDYVDGPVLKPEFSSFIGMHPIPVVYGLTVGELALMINGEGWLGQDRHCELKIIKIANYNHKREYSLPVKPSTNLPNDLSTRNYPSLGFFEGTSVSVGRGTDLPFQVLAYPNDSMGEYQFTPRKIRGSWSKLNYSGERLFGAKVDLSKTVRLSLELLLTWKAKLQAKRLPFITRPNTFDKLAGTDQLRKQIEQGLTAQEIRRRWQPALKDYLAKRQKYLLYK
jgi:uncharacterized protein YbbC (DUF1343 family)